MRGMIDWFSRNTVAANLLMLLIIVSGVIAALNVKEEVFPEFELDMINITVPYLGAAPEEVEGAVSVRIEEAIQGLDGIKQITSTASEGSGSVVVELELGADARKVVDDIKGRVDAIDTFPAETEKPIVREMTARNQVVDIAISGQTDEFTLKTIAERVRDELGSYPEVSQVDIVSARPYEIAIEVSETALRRHGLTFADVARAVRRTSLDLPGGSVRSVSGEILLRTIGQAYRGDEFERLVLMTRADGTRLHLGDVATVVDGFAETDQFARFDEAPTIMHGLGVPHGRPERARHRRPGRRLRRTDAGAPPRRDLDHGLAGLLTDPAFPPHLDVQERSHGVCARVRPAGALPGVASGGLGQSRHPDLVSGAPSRSCRGLTSRSTTSRRLPSSWSSESSSTTRSSSGRTSSRIRSVTGTGCGEPSMARRRSPNRSCSPC